MKLFEKFKNNPIKLSILNKPNKSKAQKFNFAHSFLSSLIIISNYLI
jgi:hypothetical protein